MPTTRPRHQITETNELAEALDEVAKQYPGLSRGQLIAHLALQGARDLRRTTESRRDAVRRHSGVLTDIYEPGYLDELRREWPE